MYLFPGQSQVIGPSQPIVAKVGDDIILPCHLEPAVDVVSFPLEWTRPDLNPVFVHMRRAGQDLIDTKHPSYVGRTSVSNDELRNGNISLKLSKLKPYDAGRYKCYIPKLKTGASVELVVGKCGKGQLPCFFNQYRCFQGFQIISWLVHQLDQMVLCTHVCIFYLK